MMGVPFSGMTVGILLIALAFGYIVCYLAKREEEALRFLGYLIGVLVILLSGILILNNLLLGARFCRKMGGLKTQQHKMMMKEEAPRIPLREQAPQPK